MHLPKLVPDLLRELEKATAKPKPYPLNRLQFLRSLAPSSMESRNWKILSSPASPGQRQEHAEFKPHMGPELETSSSSASEKTGIFTEKGHQRPLLKGFSWRMLRFMEAACLRFGVSLDWPGSKDISFGDYHA